MKNSIHRNIPNRKMIRCRYLIALWACALAGALLTTDRAVAGQLDTATAKRWVKDVMERSKGYANVQFDDTPGDRGIKVYRSQEHDNMKFGLSIIVEAESYYVPGTPGATASAYGARWDGFRDDDRWASSFHSSYLTEADVKKFIRALKFLAREARREEDNLDAAKLGQFKEKAKAWRNLLVKPEMAEEARRHKVLAENAYQEKDFEKAASQYLSALDIFPCWPEGQFNCALMAAEEKFYFDAILHMKYYLELVPDAPNAQAAKDKIVVWQDKIATHFTE